MCTCASVRYVMCVHTYVMCAHTSVSVKYVMCICVYNIVCILTCAARSTRIREYEVNCRRSRFNLGAIVRPSCDWMDMAEIFSKISQKLFPLDFFPIHLQKLNNNTCI